MNECNPAQHGTRLPFYVYTELSPSAHPKSLPCLRPFAAASLPKSERRGLSVPWQLAPPGARRDLRHSRSRVSSAGGGKGEPAGFCNARDPSAPSATLLTRSLLVVQMSDIELVTIVDERSPVVSLEPVLSADGQPLVVPLELIVPLHALSSSH